MENLLSVGKILNFHGIRGEVKVGYTQGKEHQLENLKTFFVEKDSKVITLNVENVRFHKQFAIIKFKEINSIDEVAEYKGCFLKSDKNKLENYLEEDEFYINDLVDLDVYDSEGNKLGKVSDVVTIGGQDLLSIEDHKNKAHLVPFVQELVPHVDIKQKRIVIRNIPGLIEDNQT